MTFDALLAGILFDQIGDVEQAHANVPVRVTEGLFHASAAIFEPIDQTRTSFVANLRADHSIDPDLIFKNKNGGIYKKMGRTRRRDFGAVMNNYDTLTTHKITWYVDGDPERIEQLIRDVAFIGKRRASGFGEVAAWEVEEGELDGLLGYVGEPLRPIPTELFEGDTSCLKVDAAWRPAYWHPMNRSICYAPEMLS